MTVVDVERYPVVITRTGPIGSRPSSAYVRAFTTRHFTVWKRRDGRRLAARLPLGDSARMPAALASCNAVRGLAEQAGANGSLVYVEPPLAVMTDPTLSDVPARWRRDPDDPVLTLPSGGGRIDATAQVPAAGRYTVWLEGSFGRTTAVAIDGQRVGSVRNRLGGRRVAERLGTVRLSPGPHTVRVERTDPWLAPGAGGLFRTVGPVYLVREGEPRVGTVPATRWSSLCGRRLDWIEAVA
jgi:hypothetical protein